MPGPQVNRYIETILTGGRNSQPVYPNLGTLTEQVYTFTDYAVSTAHPVAPPAAPPAPHRAPNGQFAKKKVTGSGRGISAWFTKVG